MITEKDLFEMGWKRFGDEENDPFYKIHLEPIVFGLDSLSGNFVSPGIFKIFSMKERYFNKISEIREIFSVNRFVIDLYLTNKYGSCTLKSEQNEQETN